MSRLSKENKHYDINSSSEMMDTTNQQQQQRLQKQTIMTVTKGKKIYTPKVYYDSPDESEEERSKQPNRSYDSKNVNMSNEPSFTPTSRSLQPQYNRMGRGNETGKQIMTTTTNPITQFYSDAELAKSLYGQSEVTQNAYSDDEEDEEDDEEKSDTIFSRQTKKHHSSSSQPSRFTSHASWGNKGAPRQVIRAEEEEEEEEEGPRYIGSPTMNPTATTTTTTTTRTSPGSPNINPTSPGERRSPRKSPSVPGSPVIQPPDKSAPTRPITTEISPPASRGPTPVPSPPRSPQRDIDQPSAPQREQEYEEQVEEQEEEEGYRRGGRDTTLRNEGYDEEFNIQGNAMKFGVPSTPYIFDAGKHYTDPPNYTRVAPKVQKKTFYNTNPDHRARIRDTLQDAEDEEYRNNIFTAQRLNGTNVEDAREAANTYVTLNKTIRRDTRVRDLSDQEVERRQKIYDWAQSYTKMSLPVVSDWREIRRKMFTEEEFTLHSIAEEIYQGAQQGCAHINMRIPHMAHIHDIYAFILDRNVSYLFSTICSRLLDKDLNLSSVVRTHASQGKDVQIDLNFAINRLKQFHWDQNSRSFIDVGPDYNTPTFTYRNSSNMTLLNQPYNTPRVEMWHPTIHSKYPVPALSLYD